MDVAAAVDFTGYNRRTVCQWIRVGKLKALFAAAEVHDPQNAISSTGSAQTITTTQTENPAGISICFGRRRNGEIDADIFPCFLKKRHRGIIPLASVEKTPIL